MAVNRTVNPPLYPDCFLRYVEESGRVRTTQTRKALQSHLGRLQRQRPAARVRDFCAADRRSSLSSLGLLSLDWW
jgi:hypothetical protein